MIDTVSLCMVVYNEGHRIYQTLNNNYLHVNEIVIVDQSSTDDTMGEVERWAADHLDTPVVYKVDKHHGFCEPSRKLAHDNSSGEWVLVLDADERISEDFAKEMRGYNQYNKLGVRMKRSLWLSGAHHFTGDYQYRFFHRDAVRYLDEIHTEPQPVTPEERLWSPPFVSIWHEKTWTEQVRDEVAYETLIKPDDHNAAEKRALNVHLRILEEQGLTAKQLDEMDPEERTKLLNLAEFHG